MDHQYRFALLGCGQIAPRHAEQIRSKAQLVAVCDIDRKRADEFAAKYLATPFYSIDDLLERAKEVEVVAVCTPNGLHAEHSIKCMNADKHVLCEKPMAIETVDARHMIEAEERTGKKLFVVKQNRFNPPVAYVKELLGENKLGVIQSFQINCFWNRPLSYYKSSWKGTMELDGGTLFTQFSHFIDLLYWFLGDVASVNGMRRNFMHQSCIEFEDAGVAFLKMQSGALGTIHYTINSTARNMEGSITLFGEKGTVKIGGQYLNELEYFSVEGLERPSLPDGKPANLYGFYEGSMSNHDKVYEHLIKALNDPNHSFINSEETAKTIEIIEKIYQSSPLLSLQ